MTNLRSYIDPDQSGTSVHPTPFKTKQNECQVRCGMCGETFFVNEEMYLFAREGIESGLDNPFKCEACEDEYDQLSYEG